MSPQRFAVPVLLAALLAAAPPARADGRPADPDIISAFLLRSDAGARSFVAAGADEKSLNAVARDWAAKADPRRVSGLAAVATPGSSAEQRLIQALSRWTGAGRIGVPREKAGAAAFLEDAAAQAEKLLGDRAVVKEIEAAVRASDQSEAIGRARSLNGRKMAAGFEPARGSAGAIGGSQAPAAAAAPRAAAPGAANDPAVVAANAAKLPSVQRPKSYSTPLAPPPLDVVQLSGSDRAINKALSVVNMESFSRGSTLNRESAEGTQATICKYLKKAKYDPDQAWGDALEARKAPGADPGDLDLRNAEHYLYAYSTTAKPNGWGDSTPVQLLMAVGWTPFKTVTKHVRPTSTPSLEEAKWGVKGAWHGQHPPDWRSTCEGGAKAVVARR